jgi:hypothetical protein
VIVFGKRMMFEGCVSGMWKISANGGTPNRSIKDSIR